MATLVALAVGLVGTTSPVAAQPDPAPMRPPVPPDPGSGSAAGSADPGSAGSAGSAGSGGVGGGGAGSGGGGPGSAMGSGSGAGSGSGGRIIQLPNDINAPAVNAAASPTTVRIGGKFTVFITATFVEGVEVNLREPIELGSVFEVTRKLSQDKPAGDGRRTREWQLEVIAWELGDLVMPPIPITYTAFGNVGEVPTNAVRLKVVGVLGELVDDPKAMRADVPPQEIIVRDWFWLYLGGGILLGLVALFVTVWIVRKRKRKTVRLVGSFGVRPRRIDMTSERALERLLAIEQSGVLERDEDRKAGFGQMVEVIRDYLGARYRVATLDLTSYELVRALRDVAPAPELGLVEKWLDRCDLVKYGGLDTGAAGGKQALEDARSLVVTTTQLAQSESSRKASSSSSGASSGASSESSGSSGSSGPSSGPSGPSSGARTSGPSSGSSGPSSGPSSGARTSGPSSGSSGPSSGARTSGPSSGSSGARTSGPSSGSSGARTSGPSSGASGATSEKGTASEERTVSEEGTASEERTVSDDHGMKSLSGASRARTDMPAIRPSHSQLSSDEAPTDAFVRPEADDASPSGTRRGIGRADLDDEPTHDGTDDYLGGKR